MAVDLIAASVFEVAVVFEVVVAAGTDIKTVFTTASVEVGSGGAVVTVSIDVVIGASVPGSSLYMVYAFQYLRQA